MEFTRIVLRTVVEYVVDGRESDFAPLCSKWPSTTKRTFANTQSENYAEPGIVVAAECSALLVIDGQDKLEVILDS